MIPLPGFLTEFLRLVVSSELFRAIISAAIGGTVTATVSVGVGMYLNHRLNHLQRVAEATHAVASDTNAVVKDE